MWRNLPTDSHSFELDEIDGTETGPTEFESASIHKKENCITRFRVPCLIAVIAILSIAIIGIVMTQSSTKPHSATPPDTTGPSTNNQLLPQNVILMIGDGMGPAIVTLARDAAVVLSGKGTETDHTDGNISKSMFSMQFAGDADSKHVLSLDSILAGFVATRSADSFVTDSAAGATAYATGYHTKNLWLSDVPEESEECAKLGLFEDDDYNATTQTGCKPVGRGTILEGAEAVGKWTGIVTSTRLTHATPAAFSSHTPTRADEEGIARQQLEQNIEVLFGGGLKRFDPLQREDKLDLLQHAKDKGYTIAQTTKELNDMVDGVSVEGVNGKEPRYLGLFADSHLPMEIDTLDKQGQTPHLRDLVSRALSVLKASPKGFFLLVEGGRIDHAEHDNDAPSAVREMLAFDLAIKEALAFAREDKQTLVVVTADHDTGGITIGADNVYGVDINGLLAVNQSAKNMAESISDKAAPTCDTTKWIGVTQSCGSCAAVVDVAKVASNGTCMAYCHSQGVACFDAWANTTMGAGANATSTQAKCSLNAPKLGCEHAFVGSSGGVCQCIASALLDVVDETFRQASFPSKVSDRTKADWGRVVDTVKLKKCEDLLEQGIQDPSCDDIMEKLDGGNSLTKVLGEVVSKALRVGFSTHGHTGVDVPLGAYGPGADRLGLESEKGGPKGGPSSKPKGGPSSKPLGLVPNVVLGKALQTLLGVDADKGYKQAYDRMKAAGIDIPVPN